MTNQQLMIQEWNWDGFSVAVCTVVAAWALERHLKKRRLGPRGLEERLADGSPAASAAGLGLLVVALLSPLATLGRHYLFSAHMAQHILLLLAVPALLLLGQPLWRAEERAPSWGSRVLRATPAGWLAGVGAMWVWHATSLCNAAVSSTPVYYFQVLSLLALGTLFWWPILGPREEERLSAFGGIAYLVSACFACTLLGIYVTFTPASICPALLHPEDTAGILPLIRGQWGMTPDADQAVGGLLMWVPGCLIYLSAVIALLARWYGSAEKDEFRPGGSAERWRQ